MSCRALRMGFAAEGSCSPSGAVFDDPNLVSCAGLAPVLTLAERAGLHDLLAEHLTLTGPGAANASVRRQTTSKAGLICAPRHTPAIRTPRPTPAPGDVGQQQQRVSAYRCPAVFTDSPLVLIQAEKTDRARRHLDGRFSPQEVRKTLKNARLRPTPTNGKIAVQRQCLLHRPRS